MFILQAVSVIFLVDIVSSYVVGSQQSIYEVIGNL